VKRAALHAKCVRVTLAALALYGAQACGPNWPAAYTAATQGARDAYERGDYAAAAAQWAKAEQVAPDERERNECRYRHAVSLQRAGKTKEATALLASLGSDTGADRQARARFDHATALVREGQDDEGFAELERAVVQFPNFGLAPKATRQLLEREQARAGAKAALVWLGKLESQVKKTDLSEVLLYERAKLVEVANGGAAALPAYRTLILRYPYPEGSYWDEAILRSAELERQVARPQRAVQWLKFMLAQREQSNFMGSYERHYSKAQWLLAEIARDDLHDWKLARTEFQRVFEQYPTSLLGDDALFEAATLSHAHGEGDEACSDVERLRESFAQSRHLAAAAALCGAQQ
jgi:tetratricopeptide (TPR) repeat protein